MTTIKKQTGILIFSGIVIAAGMIVLAVMTKSMENVIAVGIGTAMFLPMVNYSLSKKERPIFTSGC